MRRSPRRRQPRSAAWLPVPSSPGSHTLTLRARGDGPVDVLAWSVTRGRPGVIYANLGTVSAGADLMDAWDQPLLRQDLMHLSPSLIVLAFGTNEGFRDSTDPAAYASRLRRTGCANCVPPRRGAALLVLGPPDAYRHRRQGQHRAARLRRSELDRAGRTSPRSARRSVASRRARARISGTGRPRWAGRAACCVGPLTDPPMAAPDHVHLFAPGYQATAEALFRAIMEGYDRYRAMRPAA